MPDSIDHSISDVMHRTSLGCDADPLPLIFGGISCAIADYNGMQISTDLSDILFGTPRLVRTYANLGALKEEAVNIAIHGHNPVLSEIIVDVARTMDEEARQAGASGINIVGICCTGNETLMRKGVSMASQLRIAGAGAGHRRGGPARGRLPVHHALAFGDLLVHAHRDGDHHEQRPHPLRHARPVPGGGCRGVGQFDHPHGHPVLQRREPAKVKIPNVKFDVVAGFSTEQIEELCAPFVPEDPLVHMVEAIRSGQIRGIALVGRLQ